MKTWIQLGLPAILLTTLSVQAQRGTHQFPPPPAPKPDVPKVWVDSTYQPPAWSAERTSAPTYVYEQKQYGGRPAIVTPEQAQGIIDAFKAAYPKLGNPRLLIYVNRELVSESPGMKVTHGTQHIESTKSFGTGSNETASVKTVTDQSFRADDKAKPTLADKQTVRDIERLFGRPLRQAGATLVDQKVAAQLIADKPITDFVGTTDSAESRKDREAIARIADVVIELLVASKTVVVPTIADSQTVTVPDIQATAISLKDSKIIGQAAASEVLNRVPPSSLGSLGVAEITEAIALAVMEDMTGEAK
ncbi:MAG: hypothetical protein U1F65_00875 [Verrucomicrobiota bacterium]